MYRGNFDIEDYVIERTPLAHAGRIRHRDRLLPRLRGSRSRLALEVSGGDATSPSASRPRIRPLNRIWLRVAAEQDEHVWGGGEQMSYFDMRGRRFPALDLGARRRPRQDDGDHLQGGRHRQVGRRLLEHQLSAADLSLLPALCAACGDHRLFGLRFPAATTSTRSRSGPCRNGSSSPPARPSSGSSRRCPSASAASRRCRNGSMAARSSA